MAGCLLIAGSASATHGKPFIDNLLNQGYFAVIVTEDGKPITDRHFPGPVYYLSPDEDRALNRHGAAVPDEHAALALAGLDPWSLTDEQKRYLGDHEEASPPVEVDAHTTRPYISGGVVRIWTLAAIDTTHYPNDRGANFDAANAAKLDFQAKFGGTWYANAVYSNCWDATGIGTAVGDLLNDLRADMIFRCNIYGSFPEDVVIGWVKEASNNGVAYTDANPGPYAVGAEHRPSGVDWAHSAIAGHEISHLFSANHDSCGTGGIMDYCYAAGLFEGVMWSWDSDNYNIVYNNAWRCLCYGSWHTAADHGDHA